MFLMMASLALAVFAPVHADDGGVEEQSLIVNKEVCEEVKLEYGPNGCDACCRKYGYSTSKWVHQETECSCFAEHESKLRASDELRLYKPDGSFTVTMAPK